MGGQARGTIIYLIKNGKISIMDNLYPYDSTFDSNFFNSDGYSGVPSYVKSGSYYDDANNLNMKKYVEYMANDQLKRYGDAVNQISLISSKTLIIQDQVAQG